MPTTLQGAKQTIAQGPVASQLIIKQLGTNGGGFFNANSSTPYENPTPLTNLIEMVSILVIPAAYCFMFGRMVQDMRQGLAIFAAMGILFLGKLTQAGLDLLFRRGALRQKKRQPDWPIKRTLGDVAE